MHEKCKENGQSETREIFGGIQRMKVNPLEHTQPADAKLKSNFKKVTQEGNFSQVFTQTLTEKSTAANQAVAPGMTPSMPICMNENFLYVERMERSINHLEQYKDMLADSGMNLKSMDTVIGKLKKDADQLGRLLEGMTFEDQIGELMRDTLKLITNEISRFEQGVYIDD